jgi:hypothetical protein
VFSFNCQNHSVKYEVTKLLKLNSVFRRVPSSQFCGAGAASFFAEPNPKRDASSASTTPAPNFMCYIGRFLKIS